MRKPLKIDWNELEDAFNNGNRELVYYLDLVTGHLVLEGEGEEDDDEDFFDGATPPPPRRDDSTRAYIDALDPERKPGWLKRFMDEEELEPELVQKLRAGLEAEDPVRAIRTALNEHPEGREGWYRFRSDRLRGLMKRWIEKHQITPVDPPPWATDS